MLLGACIDSSFSRALESQQQQTIMLDGSEPDPRERVQDYWFEDGDCVVQVERTLFKVSSRAIGCQANDH